MANLQKGIYIMKNTIYLLTGAAGNLGSSISRILISQNKKVRALVLPGDPAEQRVPKAAEIFIGDIMNDASLEKFFTVNGESEIVVIHCASIVTVTPDFNQKVYDVNVKGTQNIIDKCIEYKVSKLVYISSISAIPELNNGETIREVGTFDPNKVIGFYGKTKAEATQLVLNAVRKEGLDASIIFPSGIYGPNDYAYGYVTNFTMDYVNEKLAAGVAGSLNAVDVRDLAKGVIACAEKGRKGEGYIMANRTLSFRELFDILHQVTGAREVKIIIPMPIARVLAFIAGIQSKITKKPAWLTSFTLYNLARNNNYSSEKAVKELGYTVRPFEETIADTISWLSDEGKIQAKIIKRKN